MINRTKGAKKMINRTNEQTIKHMMKYSPDDFYLYICEAGWESWMEEYTTAKDGEEPTEIEMVTIIKVQREMWEEVHAK